MYYKWKALKSEKYVGVFCDLMDENGFKFITN